MFDGLQWSVVVGEWRNKVVCNTLSNVLVLLHFRPRGHPDSGVKWPEHTNVGGISHTA